MTFTDPKLAEHHRQLIEQRASEAGLTVDEYLAQAARESDRQRSIWELRARRDLQFAAIARKAAAHGRRWRVAS